MKAENYLPKQALGGLAESAVGKSVSGEHMEGPDLVKSPCLKLTWSPINGMTGRPYSYCFPALRQENGRM